MSTRASAPAPTASQLASRLDRVLRTGQAYRATTVRAIGKLKEDDETCNDDNESALLRGIVDVSCLQNVSASFYKIQLDYSKNELQKAEYALKRVTNQPLQGITKSNKTTYQKEAAIKRRENKIKGVEALQYWKNCDFSQIPMPTSEVMFYPGVKNNYKALKERVGKRAFLHADYPIFDPAWSEWYLKEPSQKIDESKKQNMYQHGIGLTKKPVKQPLAYQDANLKSQTELLDTTYNEYVKENTDSKIVQMWTSEMDEAGNTPPHKRMEDFLLLKAFHKRFSHETWEQGESVKQLYDIVTSAPRCPDMMSFIRVVRNDRRLPQFWFKLKHERKMQPGESVMLPVFMSTSNSDIELSWVNQGPNSVAAEADNIDMIEPTVFGEAKCCFVQVIVSKGTPMLPLGDFNSNEHQHENEILLPPGIELVLLSSDGDVSVGADDINISTFITRVPTDTDISLIDLSKPQKCSV